VDGRTDLCPASPQKPIQLPKGKRSNTWIHPKKDADYTGMHSEIRDTKSRRIKVKNLLEKKGGCVIMKVCFGREVPRSSSLNAPRHKGGET